MGLNERSVTRLSNLARSTTSWLDPAGAITSTGGVISVSTGSGRQVSQQGATQDPGQGGRSMRLAGWTDATGGGSHGLPLPEILRGAARSGVPHTTATGRPVTFIVARPSTVGTRTTTATPANTIATGTTVATTSAGGSHTILRMTAGAGGIGLKILGRGRGRRDRRAGTVTATGIRGTYTATTAGDTNAPSEMRRLINV